MASFDARADAKMLGPGRTAALVRAALAALVLAGCAPAPNPPQWAVTCLDGTRDTVAGYLRPVDRRVEFFTNDSGIRTVASYPADLCRVTLTLDPPTGGDDGK